MTETSAKYWEKRWGAQAIAEDAPPVDLESLTDLQKRNLAVLRSPGSARLNEKTGELEVVKE